MYAASWVEPSARVSPAQWAAAALGLLAWRLERAATRRAWGRTVAVESERFVCTDSAGWSWATTLGFDAVTEVLAPPCR